MPRTHYDVTVTDSMYGIVVEELCASVGAVIAKAQMIELADKLLSMPVEEIAKLPCMPKGRADVLAGGAVLFATLMENLGFERLIVSDRDNLEGYAIKKGLME